MKIIKVSSTAELKKLVKLVYKIYRHDGTWVQPIRSMVNAQFDRKRMLLLIIVNILPPFWNVTSG